jgi:hypothetical protein
VIPGGFGVLDDPHPAVATSSAAIAKTTVRLTRRCCIPEVCTP